MKNFATFYLILKFLKKNNCLFIPSFNDYYHNYYLYYYYQPILLANS